MEPVVFTFKNSVVRQVTIKGEPGFVAKDVAEALGYNWNGKSRISHVPAEWRGVTSVVTPSGTQEMHVLFEQGLYFFLGRSDKPAAIPFQKWLAGEVLPSIRKTGVYVTPAADPLPTWQGPSSQQCELCELENRKFIWHLQGRLLANNQLWNDIRRYHAKNLNNQEIGKLVGLGRAVLRRQMRAMEECGLLCPRNKRELSRMYGPDMWHKYAIPMNYGVLPHLAKQLRQMELFPVGALGGAEA